MTYQRINPLPSAEEVLDRFPSSPGTHRVKDHRARVRNVLNGTDPRLLMIVGPCSAWSSEAVQEYADRLARFRERIHERIEVVMRCYLQKPRTSEGWPGPLIQPDPLAEQDIVKGIWSCREMMHRVGTQLPLADEMLYIGDDPYFADLLTYVALGARSSADQQHRDVASGLLSMDDDCPVGVKHPVEGSIEVGVDGVQRTQHPQHLPHGGWHVRTGGNRSAHLILRGSPAGPNYDPQSMARAAKLMKEPKRDIADPAIIVDASHGNCGNGSGKDPTLQKHVVQTVLRAREDGLDGYAMVRGCMVESFIISGRQDIAATMRRDGQSITDPCLSWEDTEVLLLQAADAADRIFGQPATR
ncbi:MAG: 2-keto-3-deoxy-D-arabino-heptulosonate-7-phospha te synthase I alpha [Candidatus Peribacter riflensis]|uniref:Phospho-2-dehydro-3-deoxyheptonate aldolase n=1 Tax=Candidatus Peribacter riflensis TaxID=1735162 RepID=A0A0S1SR25_9BACT|nr:MAG: 2-keto-3-deoxy-D-arabino-heptulosonate-7-phospha te synthase I alpha [Candidatus Peribacter riflensis]OGJ77818.1 MAG: 3-deoxy-7-phosphoheptulonate synthase [Candidatus Peribacteria bacterium RIFOXYB1_FULL_57_12]OGJ82782.1 MAG: 3-deoxy-7-phosphoheptulonate synthase [Candidatus Peribacteria bacterium RIFOXYC1_FULL_58_8]ALM11236.1 MAG: 2-keto-3-deoxy-D-arabino-heptulosonate-7-phospha te synthase I alpha [Candidatus Peribacter riflensis]ALM12339.1 MAG: 2-keto-3-deoxy-D-arabino-heptulosonate